MYSLDKARGPPSLAIDMVRPSASCLCYLFADRVIKRLTLVQRINGEPAVTVPSSGHLVLLGLLERMLLAVAIWNLQESDHITVMWSGPQANADGGRKSCDRLMVHRKASTAVPGGLEGELLGALGDQESDKCHLIRDQRLRAEELLWNDLIGVAQREAITAGVLYRSSSQQLLRTWLRLPSVGATPWRSSRRSENHGAVVRRLLWATGVRYRYSASSSRSGPTWVAQDTFAAAKTRPTCAAS